METYKNEVAKLFNVTFCVYAQDERVIIYVYNVLKSFKDAMFVSFR